MTVAELQEQLRRYNPDTELIVSCVTCGEIDVESVKLEIRDSRANERTHPVVVIACE